MRLNRDEAIDNSGNWVAIDVSKAFDFSLSAQANQVAKSAPGDKS